MSRSSLRNGLGGLRYEGREMNRKAMAERLDVLERTFYGDGHGPAQASSCANYSRKMMAWRTSNTLTGDLCFEAAKRVSRHWLRRRSLTSCVRRFGILRTRMRNPL